MTKVMSRKSASKKPAPKKAAPKKPTPKKAAPKKVASKPTPKVTAVKAIPFIHSDGILSLVCDGKPITLMEGQEQYAPTLKALRAKKWADARNFANTTAAITKFGAGKIVAKDGQIYYEGNEVHNTLTSRILDMVGAKLDAEPLIKFLENLMQNPLESSRNEMYDFMAYGQLPVTQDGHFLAYKKVRFDYKDIHSGKFDNSVGRVVTMDRDRVDSNRYNTCSAGLHFCSLAYLQHFGATGDTDRVMILKINPADVVAIPSDYNNTKGRTWKYEVVGEYGFAHEVQNTAAFESLVIDTTIKPKEEKSSKPTSVPSLQETIDRAKMIAFILNHKETKAKLAAGDTTEASIKKMSTAQATTRYNRLKGVK